MSLILYCLPVIALAVVIFVLVLRADARDRLARRAAAAGDLAKLDLALTGDALGTFSLSGHYDGLDLILESSKSAPLPGPSGRERTVCLVTLETSMPDFVVCKHSDQDAVMGPLPTVPQLTTGHSVFDQGYAVFSQVVDAEGTAGFRTAPDRTPRWWVSTQVVEQLLALGLEWARVQKGRAELALKPVHSGTAERALIAARNLAGATTGNTLPLRPPGPKRDDVGRASPSTPLFTGGGLSLFGLILGGRLLASVPWLREAYSDEVCGSGTQLVIHAHGRGYGIVCANNDGRSTDTYVLSCTILFVTIALLVSSVFSVCVLLKRKREVSPA